MKRIIPGLTLLILMIMAFQCGSPANTPQQTPEQKLNVVATTSIVADIVQNIGGDKIQLIQLIPVGADPHEFQPTPSDLVSVSKASVIFVNGFGLESFLTEMLTNSATKAAIVEVSEGIEQRQMVEGDHHDHDTEESTHAEESEHEGIDPHTWTTPANAIIFAKNIEQALSKIDPDNTVIYQRNAQTYIAQLETLDKWIQEQINTIPQQNRKLITDHTMFGYYADRYGLEQSGAILPSFSSTAEPSAQNLADLENTIKTYGIKAIFVGVTVNPALSQQIANDTGVQLIKLYTGSLGEPESGARTYIEYIQYNTKAIVAALK